MAVVNTRNGKSTRAARRVVYRYRRSDNVVSAALALGLKRVLVSPSGPASDTRYHVYEAQNCYKEIFELGRI